MYYAFHPFPRPLVRPFDVAGELSRRLDRMLADFEDATDAPFPAINVHESPERYVITAALPGVPKDRLRVTIERDVVTLAGERPAETREGCRVHRRERGALRFSRAIALPGPVDAEQTRAELKDGILTLTVAKPAAARPREIAVTA